MNLDTVYFHVIHYAVNFQEATEMRFHDVLPKLELAQSVLHMFIFKRLLQFCQSFGWKKEVHVNGSGEVSTGSEADTSCCFDIHFSLDLPTCWTCMTNLGGVLSTAAVFSVHWLYCWGPRFSTFDDLWVLRFTGWGYEANDRWEDLRSNSFLGDWITVICRIMIHGSTIPDENFWNLVFFGLFQL